MTQGRTRGDRSRSTCIDGSATTVIPTVAATTTWTAQAMTTTGTLLAEGGGAFNAVTMASAAVGRRQPALPAEVRPAWLTRYDNPAFVPFWLWGALGVWLGVHALRAYFTMVVWNVAEDAPATQMGLVALGVWVVGLAAWLPARALGQRRAVWLF